MAACSERIRAAKGSPVTANELLVLLGRAWSRLLIYPGGLLERGSKTQLRPELAVTEKTPPCFLAVAYNDEGPLASSLALLAALKAAKVPAELHVYATGGHGFGMKASDKPHAAWPARCAEWLKAEGWLGRK